MWPNPKKTSDLVAFTEEILNWKLHFLCSVTEIAVYFPMKNLELLSKLSMGNISNTSNCLENFSQICIGALNKLAPQKKKCNRGNSMTLMNKPLSRAYMKQSHFRIRFFINISEVNRIKYIKQRNYCLPKSFEKEKQYYARINEKEVANYKKFWENC